MAACGKIKINDRLELLLFKNSFKLNVEPDVVYFPDNTISNLMLNTNLFKKLPDMLEKAYKIGKQDGEKEISEKYFDFLASVGIKRG